MFGIKSSFDFSASLADRIFLGIAGWNPYFPANCYYGCAFHRRAGHVFGWCVVCKTVMVAISCDWVCHKLFGWSNGVGRGHVSSVPDGELLRCLENAFANRPVQ